MRVSRKQKIFPQKVAKIAPWLDRRLRPSPPARGGPGGRCPPEPPAPAECYPLETSFRHTSAFPLSSPSFRPPFSSFSLSLPSPFPSSPFLLLTPPMHSPKQKHNQVSNENSAHRLHVMATWHGCILDSAQPRRRFRTKPQPMLELLFQVFSTFCG